MEVMKKQIKENLSKSNSLKILVFVAIFCISQSSRADFAAPVVEMNNQVRDINENLPEVQAKPIPAELERFVKFRAVDSGMPYILVKRSIKKEQLPLLYQLMSDPGYAPYWNNIARIIGYISDDPNSIPVLLTYFQRDEGSRVESIAGKIGSIAWIGKIGGEKADPILKKALTKEGAQELAKLWIDEAKWKKSDILDKEYVIKSIRGAAIDGLVNSGKKENWELVDKLYNDPNQSDIKTKLIDAMAKKAYIIDHNNDVESFFRIDGQLMPQTLKPYLDKYDLR